MLNENVMMNVSISSQGENVQEVDVIAIGDEEKCSAVLLYVVICA